MYIQALSNAMTRETITVKVVERDLFAQAEWQQRFHDFCQGLVAAGAARRAAVNVLFPGSANPAMASLFTIDLETSGQDIDKPLNHLRELPGVQYVHTSPVRRPLARMAFRPA